MEKILTIVVPAYNAEMYIDCCLSSLCLSDLLEKIEVIVIDDGSSDRTGQIADCYKNMYPRTVHVIHKENGGHGSGINCGIKAASGRYFKVVDADDWVDGNGFRNLVHTLENADADAIVSGFYWVYDDGSGRTCNFRKKAEIKEPFHGVQYERTYFFDDIADRIYIKMHGLTIRTKLLTLHNIQTDENCYYVDTEYTLYPIPYIETIGFIRDFVYQYRIGRAGQSIDPCKMLRLQSHYDRVLSALLSFYTHCAAGIIPCSDQKLSYIACCIARIAASKVKILLYLPYGKDSKKKVIDFNRYIKQNYPFVYKANKNWGVRLLRLSGFRLYPLAWRILHIRGGIN